jgi:hypothetical protein
MVLQNQNKIVRIIRVSFFLLSIALVVGGCDLIRMKKDQRVEQQNRKSVARVNDTFLYLDELNGLARGKATKEDSISRVTAYINSWVRKQLLINEAMKNIDINEAEVERKVLDYRYSLIGYEFQNYYIKQHLDNTVTDNEVEQYYKEHTDNFVLKQNIVRCTFIKVPKEAPRTKRIKELMFSQNEKDLNELRSYCLSFSSAYHLMDSTWIEFDKLVVNSPLAEIPNKVQFLKTSPYYETNDTQSLYFLKIDEYKISDNISPLEFVREDIKNIILNKRKVELAQKLEQDVYENAIKNKDFEIYNSQ